MKRVLLWMMAAMLLSSCWGRGTNTLNSSSNSNSVTLSEREEFRYNSVLAAIEAVEALKIECEQSGNADAYVNLLSRAKDLRYDYNAEGMNEVTIEHCEQLCQRIAKLQQDIVAFVESNIISTGMVNIHSHKNLLLAENSTNPFYLEAGEMIFIEHSSSEPVTLRFNNADTQRTLKTYNSKSVKDSIKIAYSGIYTIDLLPKAKCYSSLDISARPSSQGGIYTRKSVHNETVKCNKGDWGAKPVKTIAMRNCFEEPRKFTLRGQLKAAFSGTARAIVAVPVPAGASDILYSMRISTSEQSRNSDGEFYNNLNYSYRRIDVLNMPVYESSRRSGILDMLLDDNRPISEEDAYCNLYVFRNQSDAKKFQDGGVAKSNLNYDVDASTLGTQSCNGSIPANGAKNIYLGFENERMRYTNYLWVEVVAVVPTTEYYTTKYSIQ